MYHKFARKHNRECFNYFSSLGQKSVTSNIAKRAVFWLSLRGTRGGRVRGLVTICFFPESRHPSPWNDAVYIHVEDGSFSLLQLDLFGNTLTEVCPPDDCKSSQVGQEG